MVAAFDGGAVTSDAGALLLGATDRAIGLVERFAACFTDGRVPERVEHARRDAGRRSGCSASRSATRTSSTTTSCATTRCWRCSAGKLEARRTDCAPLAGKSTLNRLEHAPLGADRYHKIGHDGAAIERAVRRSLPRRAHDAAQADRPRPRRHRRSAARPPGGPVLPRLLRLLLLSAALRLLRPASAGGQAPALEHRRRRPARSRRSARIVGQIRARWPRVGSCCAPTRALPARS